MNNSEWLTTGDIEIKPITDASHVDVAILYGLGMEDRAQHLARQLRPMKWKVGSADEHTMEELRESFRDATAGNSSNNKRSWWGRLFRGQNDE